MVVTIDPAKRLADALGLGSLTNEPSRVEGDWPGELWAMMLDTKSTFDALVADVQPLVDLVDAQRLDDVSMTFFEVMTALATGSGSSANATMAKRRSHVAWVRATTKAISRVM